MTGTLRATSRAVMLTATTLGIYAAWLPTLVIAPLSRPTFVRVRAAFLRTWARAAARILKMRIEVAGTAPRPPYLLVTNHLSYIDVVALTASAGPVFLAKSEVASWPVIGWLARTTGTLFVERAHRADLQRVLDEVGRTLTAGAGVAVFPEGTSSQGAEVLPFKPSLFEAAVRSDVPLHAASIGYHIPDDTPPTHLTVCWWGDMTFGRHFWRLLHVPAFDARIAFAPAPIRSQGVSDRKQLAELAWRDVSDRFRPVVRGAASPPPATGPDRCDTRAVPT